MQNFIITQGGKYTGEWTSVDPQKPAVYINTTEPVIIYDSITRSVGNHYEAVNGANVEIRNCRAWGENPNVRGLLYGRFVDSERAARFVVENCYMIQTGGMKIKYCPEVVVRFNDAFIIEGRESDGNGGFLDTWQWEAWKTRQFLIMRQGVNQVNSEVAWNRIINRDENGPHGRQEDVINLNSGGTEGNPTRVHHNLIVGAYGVNPESPDKYPGGGIISDGSAGKYLDIYDNYVIGCGNYGISYAGGDHVHFYNNTVVSSAMMTNGKYIGYSSVGLSFQLQRSATSTMKDNRVAWINTRPAGSAPGRNDMNFNLAQPEQVTGNTLLLPEGEMFGLDFEQQFIDEWHNLVTTNGISLGANDIANDPDPVPDPSPDESELIAALRARVDKLTSEIDSKNILIDDLKKTIDTLTSENKLLKDENKYLTAENTILAQSDRDLKTLKSIIFKT